MEGKRLEPEPAIKLGDSIILGVDDERVHSDRARRPENAAHRVGEQQFTDPLPTHTLVASQSANPGRGNCIIAWQLPSQIRRQIVQRERIGTEGVEADDPKLIADRYEDARDIPPSILAGAAAKPVVEFRLSAGKAGSVVLLAERLDADQQSPQPKSSR